MIEIYATLGPACASTETLCEMLDQGMTAVRLNLSHGNLQEAEPYLEMLREASLRCGKQPGLVIDLQGPELRISALRKPMTLRALDRIALDFVPPAVREKILPGQEILLDDGKLLLHALPDGRAEVLRGGVLRSQKSIALPGLEIRMPALTEADRENIALAVQYGVSGVMLPFVRGREDLEELRAALCEHGGEEIRVLAKIENLEGVENLPELLPAADEIVIARGDLGNAVPLWELPAVQKRIAALCREKRKAFMVVTQMLASMEHSPVPTRAEVSDVFNAVLDGASSVMLTGETAAGEYPVEAVTYLCRCVREAQNYVNYIM